MNCEGTVIDSTSGIIEAFAKYFSAVYVPSRRAETNMNAGINMPNISIGSFTTHQVSNTIRQMKNCNSVGDDEIPYFIVHDCADILASPLTSIFNRSITLCEFPSMWKRARVVPVHKSGDKATIKNYRPISILPVFSKIFERLIFDRLFSQISQYVSPLQHGFVPRRSTTTNLMIKTEFIANALDQQGQVDVVYTDFRKAFDTIDIDVTLNKLRNIGMNENVINLMNSYLKGRTHYVFYKGCRSIPYEPTSGVPQGSNLGPLLFLIFINDLPIGMRTNLLMFADDVKLFTKVTNVNDCLELQRDVDRLSNWCKNNLLELNIEKCKVVTYTRKVIYPRFVYRINKSNSTVCILSQI